MDIKELEKRGKKGKFFAPKFNMELEITDVIKKDGRYFAVWSENGKQKLMDIKYLTDSQEIKQEKTVNEPTPFPEDKKEILEEREQRVFEALRLLGRNKDSVIKCLKGEMESAMKKTMMTTIGHNEKNEYGISKSTVRTMHYANTALIAFKIAEGLFPEDKDLALGIAVCAMYHDYDQSPFGHNGENALKKAGKSFNCGQQPHNTLGGDELRFREYDNIKNAINSGYIIEKEAKKRIKSELKIDSTKDLSKEEFKKYYKLVKDKIIEIQGNLELGLEKDLQSKIDANTKENGDLADEAIQLIIMSAGNHNGERGIAHIKPDYSITYDDFCKNIRQTYISKEANKKLPIATIADAIVKLADQISSIPFDMIDGVRSGIEDEIPTDWVQPVSQFLQITEEEVIERFNTKDDKELKVLALEIQEKAIEDVIRSSNQREINMENSNLLYRLREPNILHHTSQTSTQAENDLLQNSTSDFIDILVNAITDERGAFYPELNAHFRISSQNSIRKSKSKSLFNQLVEPNTPEGIKEFYKYCLGLGKEEYEYIKSIVKEQEMNTIRAIIEEALQNNQDGYYVPVRTSNIIKYAIELAISSNEIDLVEPDGYSEEDKPMYSDEKIKTMIENINAFLKINPVDGLDRIKIITEKVKYNGAEKTSKKRIIGRDEQIAAELAIKYIVRLNEEKEVEYLKELGIIGEEEIKYLNMPYKEYAPKRNGEAGFWGGSIAETMIDYAKGCEENGKKDEKTSDANVK